VACRSSSRKSDISLLASQRIERLVPYDAEQSLRGEQDLLVRTFDFEQENVRVIGPYVGGVFGCKGAA